jgi:hypothetical protein
MSDLLSAASLILAVVGVTYGVWYPEIKKVLEMEIPRHTEDRTRIYREVSACLFTRSLPLALMATLTTLIFLPDAVKAISEMVAQIRAGGLVEFSQGYDAVTTAFCMVELLTIGFAIQAATLSGKLIKMRYHH